VVFVEVNEKVALNWKAHVFSSHSQGYGIYAAVELMMMRKNVATVLSDVEIVGESVSVSMKIAVIVVGHMFDYEVLAREILLHPLPLPLPLLRLLVLVDSLECY
jgi:hypothetical protein